LPFVNSIIFPDNWFLMLIFLAWRFMCF
jgi:hypothetical protein